MFTRQLKINVKMAKDPGTNAAAVDKLQLCFNHAHFQRADFNVERFINLARKRATLDQLHTDLKAYLRHLQNSMIELINDDYADFVNLSSGLAALRDQVDKVREDVKTTWTHFGSSVADIEKCANAVEEHLSQLAQSRRKQQEARDRLALMQAIQMLHSFLVQQEQQQHSKKARKQQRNSSYFSKLLLLVSSVELWSNRQHGPGAAVQPQVEAAKFRCYQQVREQLVGAVCGELKEAAEQGEEDSSRGRRGEKSNLALLLALLQQLRAEEHVVWQVCSTVIGPAIGFGKGQGESVEKHQRKDTQLERALDALAQLRSRWARHAREGGGQFTVDVANFLDNCLLNFLISHLDEHFSSVLVPSDARLFQRCFQLLCAKLLRPWPSRHGPQQSQLLRSIRDKFNLVVYFKLASQPLLLPLREQSKAEAFTFQPTLDDSSPCLCPYSNSLLSALDALYSPEVFLPTLANKFWEFTLQRMQDYLQWAQAVLDHFTSISSSTSTQSHQLKEPRGIPDVSSASNIAGAGRKSSSASPVPQRDPSPVALLPAAPPPWHSLAALHRELQLFDAQLFQFCLATIWVHLRQLHVDPTPFGQCLSHFSEQLGAKRKQIQQALVGQIGTELAKQLGAVSEIPRQYRWTKRPQPVGFSSYLAHAFGICERFGEETTARLGWEEEEMRDLLAQAVANAVQDFCERAEKVLDAVEQTGSSLLRFKQRKAAAAAAGQQNGGGSSEAASETDEAKIRAQLRFDANLVGQRAKEYGITGDGLERLARIEQRATMVTASADGKGNAETNGTAE